MDKGSLGTRLVAEKFLALMGGVARAFNTVGRAAVALFVIMAYLQFGEQSQRYELYSGNNQHGAKNQ
jgi:hypothetical protein